jgi:hypothetical protein
MGSPAFEATRESLWGSYGKQTKQVALPWPSCHPTSVNLSTLASICFVYYPSPRPSPSSISVRGLVQRFGRVFWPPVGLSCVLICTRGGTRRDVGASGPESSSLMQIREAAYMEGGAGQRGCTNEQSSFVRRRTWYGGRRGVGNGGGQEQ